MQLNDSIKYLKGIGEKRAELFHRLGVFTLRDLLYHLPRGYEDRTQMHDISDLIAGESVCVRGSVVGVKTFKARTGMRVTQAKISDGTGIMQMVWFNAPYIEKLLDGDNEYIFFGLVIFKGMTKEMVNPIMEKAEESGKKTGRIVPIYPCTAGLNQRNIRDGVVQALEKLSEPIPEIIPKYIVDKYCLLSAAEAIHDVHMASDFEKFNIARRRLVFEEFLILQLGIASVKREKYSRKARAFSDVRCVADFARGLKFELTNAQKRVINEICIDLKKPIPMNRLVQGDVGSGKTIVAAAVMFAAVKSGFQAAIMAPTEILAEQHYKNFKELFSPYGIEVAFLSGGQSLKEHNENAEKIVSGTAKIIIGTHALITEKVEFKNLALTITDEQHRFGVRQRSQLTGKGINAHTLVMTATPIPRTLSLIIYGDLDVSIIDELPPGRKKIETFAVDEKMRDRVNKFIKARIDEGRQVYCVCPLVEESEVIEATAVDEYAEKLRKTAVLKNLIIEELYGRMKSWEKEEIMRRFVNGEIDILVATTVIEVGVDVPNATVMIIESGERFG
ncbi:MAG: ATP-dependent DNA helicase RecG, partial [Oscillospiraceae bacterium]